MRKIIYLLATLILSTSYYSQTVTATFSGQNCFFDNETPLFGVWISANNLSIQDPLPGSITSINQVLTVNGTVVYSDLGYSSISHYYQFNANAATTTYNVQVKRTIYSSNSSGNFTTVVECNTSFNTVAVSSPRIFYSGNNLTGGILGICEGDYVTLSNTVNTGGSFTWSTTGSEVISGSTTNSTVSALCNGAGSINLNYEKNSMECYLNKTVSVTIKNKSIVEEAQSSTKIYSFVPNELFIVSNVNGKGTLLKVKSVNGSGANMLALQPSAGNYSNLSGYTYLLGSQNFKSNITALTYANGQTFIGFANGKLLKVSGTGGTGANMFNVTENSTTFVNGSGTTYRLGDQLFQSAVNVVTYANSQTFVGLSSGKLLKVNGTGGTGSNMFNVTENAGGFTTSSTLYTAYRLGDQVFQGGVYVVTYTNNQTLIGLSNGKLLKVSGTGGTGSNMFNVSEISGGFTTSSTLYTAYRLGDQVFSSAVTTITVAGTQTFIGMANGRLLKITGTGGTGFNMFNVSETSNGFVSDPAFTAYRLGDQIFLSDVSSIIYTGTQTLIGLSNGRLLKVTGTGGTGTNMFNVSQTSTGFTSSSSFTIYRLGDQIFQSKVTSIFYDGTQTYIGLANGKILKVTSTGGTGANMFNVTEIASGFQNGNTGTNYRIGDQLFVNIQCSGIEIVKLGKSMTTVEPTELIAQKDLKITNDLSEISVFPNPFSSDFTLTGLDQNENYDLTIVDITGKTIMSGTLDASNSTINLDDQLSGMYFVFIKNNEQTTKIKVIKQ